MADAKLMIEAAKNGRVDEVRKRLDAGATDDEIGLGLIWAAYTNQLEVARLLIEHGADLSYKAKDDSKTAYVYACEEKHLEMAALLAAAMENPRGKPARENWVPMGAASVAFVGVYPELGKKLSQVFNFETRERFLISENLGTKSEGVGSATSFDDLPPSAVEKALSEFERLGGTTDRDFALQGAPALGKTRKLPGAPGHG